MPMGAVAMDESQTPPNLYLLEYILTLAIAAVVGTIAYKSAQSPKNLLASAGVSVRKVARAVTEIERKTFHLAGLLVPLIHQLMLSNGFSNASCVRLCWAITITGVCADCLRLKVDVVRRNWPMRQLLREHEQKQMTGGSSFSLGCTLTIAISPPSIARPAPSWQGGRPIVPHGAVYQPRHCPHATKPAMRSPTIDSTTHSCAWP